MSEMSFANPNFLWLLLALPVMIAWYIYKIFYKANALLISSPALFNGYTPTLKTYFQHFPFFLRSIAVAALIVALARPQSKHSWQDVKTEGIDIVLAIDISASMLAKDLKPDRLEASKAVATKFIENRPDDRIGLVIFSGESFTQCPLTTDHTVLKNLFSSVKTGMVQDGTAIGMGLATAVSRLKDSKAKSKVVILLTDGVNNSGSIAPELAADLARPFGIRIYTIGVGTKGMALSPVNIYPNGQYVYDYVKVDIDESVLKKISNATGGKYFRATDNAKLKAIYAEIDKMEKTIIEEKQYSRKAELFHPLAIAAFVLLIVEFLLKNTVFKTITGY
jgi:Ca-activated chloride channel family protein